MKMNVKRIVIVIVVLMIVSLFVTFRHYENQEGQAIGVFKNPVSKSITILYAHNDNTTYHLWSYPVRSIRVETYGGTRVTAIRPGRVFDTDQFSILLTAFRK